jgi:hypothetical protein
MTFSQTYDSKGQASLSQFHCFCSVVSTVFFHSFLTISWDSQVITSAIHDAHLNVAEATNKDCLQQQDANYEKWSCWVV